MPLDPAIPPGKASEMWFTALVRSHSPAHVCNADEKRPFRISAPSVELEVLHLSGSLVSERVNQHVKLTSFLQCSSQVGLVLCAAKVRTLNSVNISNTIPVLDMD